MEKPIRLALPKGELLNATVGQLLEAGVLSEAAGETAKSSRSLVWKLGQGIEALLCRPGDVPTYVKYGAADLGICGKDVLMENGGSSVELADLKYGKCRFVWAQPKGKKDLNQENYIHLGQLRVASKFPKVTEAFFAKKGIQIEVIKLKGAVELAPLVGLADQIVDLASTGNTLKENGLEVIEVIAECSARLIANPASLKLKYETLAPILEAIEAVAASD